MPDTKEILDSVDSLMSGVSQKTAPSIDLEPCMLPSLSTPMLPSDDIDIMKRAGNIIERFEPRYWPELELKLRNGIKIGGVTSEEQEIMLRAIMLTETKRGAGIWK